MITHVHSFKPGNVVALHKGKRLRTINEIRDGRAKLHWFVGSRLYKKWVPLDILRLVSP